MGPNYDICDECGINITLSGTHLPFCSKSEGDLPPIVEGTEDETLMKFSTSLISVVEERVLKVIMLALESLPKEQQLDDAETQDTVDTTKMVTAVSVMVTLQILMEQDLLDREKFIESVEMFGINWDDLS